MDMLECIFLHRAPIDFLVLENRGEREDGGDSGSDSDSDSESDSDGGR